MGDAVQAQGDVGHHRHVLRLRGEVRQPWGSRLTLLTAQVNVRLTLFERQLTLQLDAPLVRQRQATLGLNSTLVGAHVFQLDLVDAVGMQIR